MLSRCPASPSGRDCPHPLQTNGLFHPQRSRAPRTMGFSFFLYREPRLPVATPLHRLVPADLPGLGPLLENLYRSSNLGSFRTKARKACHLDTNNTAIQAGITTTTVR